MRKFAFYGLTLTLLLWLQLALDALGGPSGLTVHLLLMATLFFGLMRGPVLGECMGGAWGLLLDAGRIGPLGLQLVLLTLAGFSGGMLRRQLDGAKPWTQAIFTGLASAAYLAAFAALDHAFSRSPRPWNWILLLEPVLNAFLAPAAFRLFCRWVELWGVFPVIEE